MKLKIAIASVLAAAILGNIGVRTASNGEITDVFSGHGTIFTDRNYRLNPIREIDINPFNYWFAHSDEFRREIFRSINESRRSGGAISHAPDSADKQTQE